MSLIHLPKVLYDARARDGTWCLRPYEGHPHGCPQYLKCRPWTRPDFKVLRGCGWYAVVEEYDLEAHAARQREKHPGWTYKQLRNPRHWQKGVMKRLREKTYSLSNRLLGDVVLEIPEASGVNVLGTMALAGRPIQMKDPKMIQKVMLIGKTVVE